MRSHRPDLKAFASLAHEVLEYIDWLEHERDRLEYDLNFIKGKELKEFQIY